MVSWSGVKDKHSYRTIAFKLVLQYVLTSPVFFQVGDSIVHKARETLERAIKMVNDTKKWGARVVYGDTDR